MDTSNPARQNLEDILKDPTFEDEVLNSIFAEAHALPAQAGDAVDGGTGERARTPTDEVADDAMRRHPEDGGMLLNNVAEDGLTLPQKPIMEHQRVVSLPILPPLRMKGTQGLHPKPTDARTLPMSPRRTRAMRASVSDTVLVQGGTAARNKFMPSGSYGRASQQLRQPASDIFNMNRAVNENRKDREKALALNRMLDDLIKAPLFKVTEPRARRVLTPRSLREALRTQDAQDSVIRIFRKFDVDGSGSVDRREFTAAIMATVEGATHSDVSDLFIEFDLDNSGKISYKEMHEVMTHAAKEAVRQRQQFDTRLRLPELPPALQRRKQVLLEIHRKFKSNTVGTAADGTRLPDLTLEQCLRMCFPRDTRETTSALVQWLEGVEVAHKLAAEARVRQNDANLIAELDANCDGKITMRELSALSLRAGFNLGQLRSSFRKKDVEHVGFLEPESMHELLAELRRDAGHASARVGLAPSSTQARGKRPEQRETEERWVS